MDQIMDIYRILYVVGSGAGAISCDLEFGRELLILRQARILFGTDFLSPLQAVPQLEIFDQKLSELPAEEKAKVHRESARKLLRLI